ncbi:hypothetical protein D3C71_1289350 [compost metagenome]
MALAIFADRECLVIDVQKQDILRLQQGVIGGLKHRAAEPGATFDCDHACPRAEFLVADLKPHAYQVGAGINVQAVGAFAQGIFLDPARQAWAPRM